MSMTFHPQFKRALFRAAQSLRLNGKGEAELAKLEADPSATFMMPLPRFLHFLKPGARLE